MPVEETARRANNRRSASRTAVSWFMRKNRNLAETRTVPFSRSPSVVAVAGQ